MAEATSSDALIESLQALQSKVEATKTGDPLALPGLLSSAISETKELLSALPPSQAEPWLSELSALSPSCTHEKKDPVPCIHRCGHAFCSPTCRRQLARRHAAVCPALRNAKLLKKLGLADSELF